MKLFSYCLRYDDGAAPNPFWELCTLAICKPAIRRAANIGDWVVGLGSAHSPIGNISSCIVYTMQVTDKMTQQEYDEFCRVHSPYKIPKWNSQKFEHRVGDCIYDYSQGTPPTLRASVHNESNREQDLGGVYVLMSRHFYYFGDKPIPLPTSLTPIIHAQQGHKSTANQPYVNEFVAWIENLGYVPNKVYGEPQLKKEFILAPDIGSHCARRDREDDGYDEEPSC
ncbi:hypothetical protein H6F98_07250 [Microcoleus sp. FACHB-SPT15]|uniref:Nmad2 family putative nucleotide modification protein n=1 Tax=Microcoleus sp. FACHB-SPT15 TaxID=2692830 RepID=UPI00177D06D4|nr:hypothetical protein [Microcoleus sp. FACHB-SPT15]MBD1805245.1 hypothetical protein [Microcoleus sp. FACHB-SPT15]